MIDISLTEGEDGHVLMHRPDCPMVERHRVEGRPVVTLYDCELMPTEVARHDCLGPEDERPRAGTA